MAAPVYYSADMVRDLPDDGKRYETVHGELLVTPAPRVWHQMVLERVHEALHSFVKQNELGIILRAPADISWGDDILVQPDLFVANVEEARSLDWSQIKTLSLTVEVLSPSTSRYDRFTKRKLYQSVGVHTYWIVEPDAHFVEVWTPKAVFPTVERDRIVWAPPSAPEPLTIDLNQLFKTL